MARLPNLLRGVAALLDAQPPVASRAAENPVLIESATASANPPVRGSSPAVPWDDTGSSYGGQNRGSDDFSNPPDWDDECDCGCSDIEELDDFEAPGERAFDWKRWYESPRRESGRPIPRTVLEGFLDELREATMLHSVAVRELVRKWGFEEEP